MNTITETEESSQIDFIMQVTSEWFLQELELEPIEDFKERFEFIINDEDLAKKYALFNIKEIQALIFDASGKRAQKAREAFNKGNSQQLN